MRDSPEGGQGLVGSVANETRMEIVFSIVFWENGLQPIFLTCILQLFMFGSSSLHNYQLIFAHPILTNMYLTTIDATRNL